MFNQKKNIFTAAILIVIVSILTLFSVLTLYSYARSENINEMRRQNRALVNHLEGALVVKSALAENNASVIRNFDAAIVPLINLFAEQVEGVDEVALVFLNAETERVNVMYRNKQGGFGLIDPNI